MPKHRSHSIEFTRQVAQEFLAGKTQHGLAKRKVPVPTLEDFREGGSINQCLKENPRQLSNACWVRDH
jgi:hypothetical protein